MNGHYKSKVRKGLPLLGLVLFVMGMVLLPCLKAMSILALLSAGFLAGALGGLLGLGGGILIMPLLRFGFGLQSATAAGTCIVGVFCTTLAGSYRHYKLGHIHFPSLLPVIVSGAMVTVLFSFAFTMVLGAQIKVAIGSSLACFMVNAFLSAAFKFTQGFVDLGLAVPIGLGAVLGSNLGAKLNARFPASWLKRLFAWVFFYIGLKFILSSQGVGV